MEDWCAGKGEPSWQEDAECVKMFPKRHKMVRLSIDFRLSISILSIRLFDKNREIRFLSNIDQGPFHFRPSVDLLLNFY